MTKLFYTLLLVIAGSTLFAQHNPHFSHFMFNKLAINPAYAGSKEALSVMALYRHQWDGIVGAPRTGTAAAHLPLFGNRVGAGIRVVSDRVGMLHNTYANMAYAYRLKFKGGSTLSAGINLEVENTRFDWSRALIQDVQDDEIPFDADAQTNFNVGAGLYYQSKLFYLGVSLPQIMRNPLYDDIFESISDLARVRSHYLIGGLTLPLGKNVSLQPSFLVTYVPNAPLDIDANLSFLLFNKLWIGGTYRKDDSADVMLGFQFNKQWRLGISYDYTYSELNPFSRGSGEVMIEHTFDYDNEKLNNIRFF
ncbi:MAG: type IX secretion system membrane protein PorP/SprF [Saprospiraceae bacterium]